MTNNNSQKGFAMPIIIAIVAIVLVLGGVVYYANQPRIQEDKMAQEKTMTEKEAMEKKDGTMMGKDFSAVIAKASSINLKDVSKSGASGTAWLAVYSGKTYHQVVAKNMPTLPGADFYEGWLVKNAVTGDFFSSGKMNYNPTTREATLNFVVEGDKSDYRFIVITSEPDDGNPKPDKHIIEERFSANANLQVVLDVMMEKKEEGTMVDKGEAMMKYSGAVLAGKSAPLLDFAKADYDAAVKTDKLIVLYFYANWCPICKAEFPVMQKAFNELNTDKVIGFRVNYNDDQTDNDEKNLAKQFGVAYQHTKVFVKKGQRILKSPEGWDEKRYDMEISKALGQ